MKMEILGFIEVHRRENKEPVLIGLSHITNVSGNEITLDYRTVMNGQASIICDEPYTVICQKIQAATAK